jgi:hypothetical protein
MISGHNSPIAQYVQYIRATDNRPAGRRVILWARTRTRVEISLQHGRRGFAFSNFVPAASPSRV